MSSEATSFYVTGGALAPDAPSYVERAADRELLNGLLQGEFCYVLTSRQMGKSSLMARTATRLRAEGAHVIALDLTAVGQNVTHEQWYYGLLTVMGDQLGLGDELAEFWSAHEGLGPVQRWFAAIRRGVLSRRTGSVVIFVDEIDTVRSLPFSTDEFFAAIRECYNRRSGDAEFKRLTFCLLGVAAPNDLIRDIRITPFNVGRRIELNDFTPGEAQPLARGLRTDSPRALRAIRRVLGWTGGHPYLTQKLCLAVAQELQAGRRGDVDAVCAELFLSNRARERDDNLIFVRDRILRSEADVTGLLELYLRIWSGRRVVDHEANPLASALRLSGIVRPDRGRLVERNRIYSRVFDRAWARTNFPGEEQRRQRAAYWRGVARATSVSAAIIVALGLLGLVALKKSVETSLAQARAWITSGVIGQRTEALRLIRRAQSWPLPFKPGREPRNAAIAAVHLWDLDELPSLESPVPGATGFETNETLTRRAVGGADGRISVLGPAGRNVEWESAPTGLPVRWIRFSPRDRYVAAGYGDDTSRRYRFAVWDLGEHDPHKSRILDLEDRVSIHAIDFSADSGRVAVGAGGRRVRIYALPGGETVFESPFNSSAATEVSVTCVRFDASGTRLAECSDGSLLVNLWDTTTNRPTTLQLPSGVVAVEWHPNGLELATACESGVVHLWNLPSGIRELVCKTSTGAATPDLCFNHAGTVLAVLCTDSTLRFFQAQTLRQVLASDLDPAERLQFSAGDRLLRVTTREGRIRRWTVSGGRELRTFRRTTAVATPFQSLAFDPGSRILIAAGGVPGIWFWDFQEPGTPLQLHAQTVVGLGTDLNGRELLASTGDGFYRFPLTETGDAGEQRVQAGPGSVIALPSGLRRLALATNGTAAVIHIQRLGRDSGQVIPEHIHVFDVRDPESNSIVSAHRSLEDVALSPDGRWLAASSPGNTIVWDRNGRAGSEVRREFPGSNCLAFSPSGRWIVTAPAGEFQFRRSGSWEPCRELSIPRHYPRERWAPLAFGRLPGPDECLVAAAVTPAAIKLYRLRDRPAPRLEELAELVSPEHQALTTLAFSPNGRFLGATTEDPIVLVWDLRAIDEELAAVGIQSGLAFPGSEPEGLPLSISVSDGDLAKSGEASMTVLRWSLVEDYSQAIANGRASDPTGYLRALRNRGSVYFSLERYSMARRDFAEALALRPGDPEIKEFLEKLNRLEDSRDRKAIAPESTPPRAIPQISSLPD
jgi:WD40 repeat protein